MVAGSASDEMTRTERLHLQESPPASAGRYPADTLLEMPTNSSPSPSDPQKNAGARDPQAQLVTALGVGVLVMLASSLVLVGFRPLAIGISALTYALGGGLARWLFRQGFPHPSLGAGNRITLGRLALVASLIAPLVEASTPWVFLVVALLALALDGVDGYLARRQGRVSAFGARLDMEVDAALTVTLALNAILVGSVGLIALLLFLPRYLFVLAGRFAPWLRRPLPERFSRKVVTVVQVGTLIALQLPVLVELFATPLVLLAGGALIWSFSRDVWWLWQQRHSGQDDDA